MRCFFISLASPTPLALSPADPGPSLEAAQAVGRELIQPEAVPVPSLGDAAAAAAGAPGSGLDSALTDAALELGGWPHHFVMQGVEWLHVTSGLPYWATIVCITLGLRTCMVPIALGTMRNTARMSHAKPEMELLQERMKVRSGTFLLLSAWLA